MWPLLGVGRPDGRVTVILPPKGAGQNISLEVAFGLGPVGQLRGLQADKQGHHWRWVEQTACVKPGIFKEICGGEKGLGTTIVSYMLMLPDSQSGAST